MNARSAGLALFFALLLVAALAVVADQWRHSVRGVHLVVEGAVNTSAARVRRMAGLTDSTQLADLDLMTVRRAILGDPFIRDAEVRRDGAGVLYVRLEERRPVALLLNVDAQDWLIDVDGVVLPPRHAPAVNDLPVITGAEALGGLKPGMRVLDARLQHALQFLRVAAETDGGMLPFFSEISIRERRDLVLYTLEAGVPVIFGGLERAADKLRSFRAFWINVAMKGDPEDFEYIDLRFDRQVVVRRRSAGPVTTAPADSMTITGLPQ